jgi:hypothetical protein
MASGSLMMMVPTVNQLTALFGRVALQVLRTYEGEPFTREETRMFLVRLREGLEGASETLNDVIELYEDGKSPHVSSGAHAEWIQH